MGRANFKYDTAGRSLSQPPSICVSVIIVHNKSTLDSGIDIGQGINVRPGIFGKKNKRRA